MSRDRVRPELSSSRLFEQSSSKNLTGGQVDSTYYNFMTASFDNKEYLEDSLQFGITAPLIYQLDLLKDDIDDLHSEVSSSVYDSQINSGSYISQIKTFADRDATPSVEGGSVFVTANTRATSISAFDDPTEGQQITIIIKDTHTDFTNGGISGKGVGRLLLQGNQHWGAATTGDTISFVYNNEIWIETNRSDNT